MFWRICTHFRWLPLQVAVFRAIGASGLVIALTGAPARGAAGTAAVAPAGATASAPADLRITWVSVAFQSRRTLGQRAMPPSTLQLQGRIHGQRHQSMAVDRIIVHEAVDEQGQPLPVPPIYHLIGPDTPPAGPGSPQRLQFTTGHCDVPLQFSGADFRPERIGLLRGEVQLFLVTEAEVREFPLAPLAPTTIAPGLTVAITPPAEAGQGSWRIELHQHAERRPTLREPDAVMALAVGHRTLEPESSWQPVDGEPGLWRCHLEIAPLTRPGESAPTVRIASIRQMNRVTVPFELRDVPRP